MGKLTKRQKDTLKAIGKEGQNFKIRGTLLNERPVNIDNRITTIYEGLKDSLLYVDDYFPIFARRIRHDKVDVKALLLSLNRKIRKEMKKK